MRSKQGKIKLLLDRAERLKYKKERRIDKMKISIVELKKIINELKEKLQENV